MNKAKLKSYAPAARRDFIQAVTDRAHFFGLSEKQILPVEESGDVAIIGGRPFPRAVAAQRRKLDARVKRDGFSQVMEAVAYTWFNRFLALRYMELHGYLEHGFRVLSNTGSSTVPEILDHAAQLELNGLNKQKVVELKLDGSKDAELYRLLLVAQCNALHAAMPFLFEKIEDETELLLPDNLLHSDSLIRKLVSEIEEEDWQEVEIIGWLYQFYISEKKDQVIGKVVKSEDIPAATQLFTPNWIVKYMVQNSLGRKWLATYPDSTLKFRMEYYIEPAEQTTEVNGQLAAIIPSSLNPEELTLLDPACGSGHILVEAYDVFKEIYLERGYSNRDFPRLILEKNLYGLDIDDRAAQMAGFALLMKARKDDRRILRNDKPVSLNVMAIQESGEFSIESSEWGEHTNTVRELVDLFKHGKTFGSLIQIPKALAAKLRSFLEVMNQNKITDDLFAVQAGTQLAPLLRQAKVLAGTFDCVAANPPYMGNGAMNNSLKNFSKVAYPDSKSDLFAMFIERIHQMTKLNFGISSLITQQAWMFLGSFEVLRSKLSKSSTISTMAHNGFGAFGADFGTTSFTQINRPISGYRGTYISLREEKNVDDKNALFLTGKNRFILANDEFSKIPGQPIAYWVGENTRNAFNLSTISNFVTPKQGLATGNNDKYLRFWWEVKVADINFTAESRETAKLSQKTWFPYSKGGVSRKWYGSNEYVVYFPNDGDEIRNLKDELGNEKSRFRAADYYFKEAITWSLICSSSSGGFSARYRPCGFVFDINGMSAFGRDIIEILSLLNSKVGDHFLKLINPTMAFQLGDISRVPVTREINNKTLSSNAEKCIGITKNNWDEFEISWDFKSTILCGNSNNTKSSWEKWHSQNITDFEELIRAEEENNHLLIDLYELRNELTPEVTGDQVSLACADREVDMKRLISYGIGCMMGRYSLDQPGLVYANSSNNDFDTTNYKTFFADDDGIVPIMDMDWFPDDAASRFEEFLKVAWSHETLEENLKFISDSLSPKSGETPRETIRRYISTQFYKDHLQTYKKRPIYWLFSSGKQRAFECLVYLHRYNESTLSRMRNEYVTPLQGKFSAQADYLSNEVNAVSSTAERNKLQKLLDILRKKQVELTSFDDLLRHYADQRISLDLDDGVKVNYGKFGSLLAEVKVVSGGSE